jgi:hypothetical protein
VSQGIRKPIRGTFDGGCASVASGTTRKLRISMTMHPMALHHMVFPPVSRMPTFGLLWKPHPGGSRLFFLEKCL